MTDRQIPIKKILVSILVFIVSILMLQLLAIHNGFPLLMGDSKNYIWMGLHFTENSHWSNTYIYFIGKNIQFFNTVQWVPIIQNCMILSILFYLCHLMFAQNKLLKYFVIVFGLIFTALPWISNMIMSDISTPICLLIIITLVNYRVSLIQAIPLYFGFILLSSWHQSHIAIMPLFLIVALIVKLIQERSIFRQQLRSIGLRIFPLLLLVIASFIIEKHILDKPAPPQKKRAAAANIENTTEVSSGYYFIGVRLWEVNELDNMLATFCPEHPDSYLCDPANNYEIKVHLPKHQDRNQNNQNYIKQSLDNKEFIISCLPKPRFYYAMLKVVIKRSWNLLEHTKIRRYSPSVPNVPKQGNFNQSFNKISKNEHKAFRNAQQLKGKYIGKFYPKYLMMDLLWWYGILPLVLLFAGYTWYRGNRQKLLNKESWFLLLALPLAHLINTVICATFSNDNNFRYSSRTVWLMNLAIILLCIFVIEAKRKIQSSPDETNRTDTLS